MTKPAQDTEAIRAALNRSSGPRVLEADAALGRLVARLEAAERAVEQEQATNEQNWRDAYHLGFKEGQAARAALAAAALGETTLAERCNVPVTAANKTVPCCLLKGHEGRHVPYKLSAYNALIPAAPGETEQTP